MLSKLAFRNVRRSIKDYLIYLITVTLAFSLIFSFNLIIFSKDILELSSMMENLQPAIIFVSIIIIFVIGWLIHYTMKFMLQKRSKEFGTYLLLGIEKKQITRMFLLENIMMGFFSLLLSLILGFLFSQCMTMLIMNIFRLPYQVNFSMDWKPILLTFSYFLIIYLFVLLRARHKVKKMKLYDLLYLDKMNESKIYKTKKIRILIFGISVVLGISSLIIFHQSLVAVLKNESSNSMLMIGVSLGLLIISIYGITLTIADFLISLILRKKEIKYRNHFLFLTRQFTSKLKTMGITMGTLSLLVTLTLVALNVSNLFYGLFQTQTENAAPYDIMIYNLYSDTEEIVGEDNRHSLTEYLDFVKTNYTIKESITYNVYTDRGNPIRRYISDGVTGYQPFDCYIKLSDYNKLLEMRNMDPISLKPEKYFIHGFRDVKKELEKYLEKRESIIVGEQKLDNQGMTTRQFTTSWSRGSSYIIIVPDSVITDQFEIINQITAINTKEPTTESFAKQFDEKFPPKVFVEDREQYQTLISIQQTTVKGQVEGENRSMLTIISFSLMYLALIFIAVVGTILAIQSLSDSTKYQYRYTTLNKLGMEKQEVYQTLFQQLLLFFTAPILYPIIISMVTANSLGLIFDPFMRNDYTILLYVILNIGIFLFVYIIYFLATYFGFKNNIREKTK